MFQPSTPLPTQASPLKPLTRWIKMSGLLFLPISLTSLCQNTDFTTHPNSKMALGITEERVDGDVHCSSLGDQGQSLTQGASSATANQLSERAEQISKSRNVGSFKLRGGHAIEQITTHPQLATGLKAFHHGSKDAQNPEAQQPCAFAFTLPNPDAIKKLSAPFKYASTTPAARNAKETKRSDEASDTGDTPIQTPPKEA